MTQHRIPTIETARLRIRPFRLTDLDQWHPIGERCWGDGSRIDDPNAKAETYEWLQWQVLNERFKCKWWSDKVIELQSTCQLIGMIGLVPTFAPYGKMAALRLNNVPDELSNMEISMQWAVDPSHQGQGYATEAAKALIDFIFGNDELRVWRVIADTDFDNLASQAVMRKLGMRLEHNESKEPPWLQVVGVLENK